MRKLCVFCGNKPVNKNKEHVIPQWLIKYTGDPKRITLISNKDGKDIKFSWLNFVFPACEVCNSNFAKVEGKIPKILENINEEKSLSHSEINLFLDWLDKIRIGLWLGHAMLQDRDFEPKFFINDRVGSKDRICLMYKFNDHDLGIGVIGADTPVFQNTPSCFSIIINNMVFFNYSKEFLLSKNIGFPYPNSYKYINNGDIVVSKLLNGENKVTYPVIDGKIIKPSINFYQSIIKGDHRINKPFAGVGYKFFKSNYLVFKNDLIQSRLYIIDEHKDYDGFWPQKKLLTFKFIEKFEKALLFPAIIKQTLEHQNHSISDFINNYPIKDLKEKTTFDTFYKHIIDLNNEKINEIKKVLKDFLLTI